MSEERDIVERLKALDDDDHERLTCRARYAECSCGYLERLQTAVPEAASEITRLRGEVERLSREGWQTIDSAPKDRAIIAADFGRYGFLARAWWQPEFDAWITGCREMVMAPGYTINGKSRELHSPEIVKPTHWLPLPAPPSKDTAG